MYVIKKWQDLNQSDISNSALKIFLQEVGEFYYEARGFEKFGSKKKQKEELLKYFEKQCCFCGKKIDIKSLSQDHLVPMNKSYFMITFMG